MSDRPLEIERKFLLKRLPDNLEQYESCKIEQGYLCTGPVVRIRRQNDEYYLTYKGKGQMVREEYNLPLTEKAYCHLKKKADGILIRKIRYRIPLPEDASGCRLTVELDVFDEPYSGLYLAEVEFPDEDAARRFVTPDWFGEDVTFDKRYHNSYLSKGVQSDG